jgi:hypothetical protein
MAAAMAGPGMAWAEGNLQPYIGDDIVHNTNIFATSRYSNLFPPGQDPSPGDTLSTYLAGLNGTYMWSQQSLTANVEARHVDYNHFSDLNHNEHVISADLAWKLLSELDGTVDYAEDSLMTPFTDRVSTQLFLEKQRTEGVTAKLHFAADWAANAGISIRDLQYPQPTLPDLGLHETTTVLGIKYLGLGALTYGLSGTHLEGRFRGNNVDADYNQNTYQLDANYVVSDLTTFNASLGDTTRDQAGTGGNISAITGALGYMRRLTGKTTINLQFLRAVNSYITGGGSELDTSGTANVAWQATPKLGVALNYGYTQSKFSQQTVPGLVIGSRTDKSTNAGLNLDYEPLRWLSIKPFLTYQDRTSSVNYFIFNGTTYGVNLKATFH